MESKTDTKRMNVEVDRLSTLPDELIHKILSFIDIKHAIETSALSSRWRFLWTSMPYLEFSNQGFPTPFKFSQFITHVLSHRSNIAQLFSIKLHYFGYFSRDFVKQLLNYAFSHNIQQLDFKYVLENDIEIPLSIFSSRSLKDLSLSKDVVRSSFLYSITGTSTWELPALTTLSLHYVTFCVGNNDKCVGLFSKCVNLKILTLVSCKIKGTDHLSISHPRLTNLTLENDYDSWQYINLVAPQLKTLTIRNSLWDSYQISAPELVSLSYSGSHPMLLSTKGFPSLEKVDLCVHNLKDADAPRIVRLFQHFQRVKFLRLNLEIFELLSSYMEIISRKPSPFENLKSLKIYPVKEFLDEAWGEKVNMSTKVKNYLLSNSPNATFTMFSREEITYMKNTIFAQKLMAELRVLLEQEKAKTETNRAHAEEGKTHKLQIEERVKHMKRCWKHLSAEIKQGKAKTRDIISKLKDLKVLLKKLPASKRAEMQPCFSSLCSEADSVVVVGNILDNMKLQCDMKRSRFSVYFNEFASTS